MAQPFTAFTGTDGINTALFSSVMNSLMEGSTASSRPSQSPTVASASTAEATTSALETRTSNQQLPTTFSTLPSSSRSSITSNPTAASTATNISGATSTSVVPTTSNTASSSDSGLSRDKCNGVSCSPGLQAAIAVPVVVGVLALAALIFFLTRRRKRNTQKSSVTEEKPKKTWTRHLRIFSFDNEILTGGRFSSSNSTRSGQSHQHLATSSPSRENHSVQSVEDAAPSYRDAVSHTTQPNMTQAGTGVAAGGLAAGGLAASTIPRSTSRASAPPPYGQATDPSHTDATAPTETTRDPFVDAAPAGAAATRSPFGDPSEDGRSVSSRPPISRNSSIHTGVSSMEESEAGSIREAQVGRHLSVISGGRTITNVRNSSQSPPQSNTPPSHD